MIPDGRPRQPRPAESWLCRPPGHSGPLRTICPFFAMTCHFVTVSLFHVTCLLLMVTLFPRDAFLWGDAQSGDTVTLVPRAHFLCLKNQLSHSSLLPGCCDSDKKGSTAARGERCHHTCNRGGNFSWVCCVLIRRRSLPFHVGPLVLCPWQ